MTFRMLLLSLGLLAAFSGAAWSEEEDMEPDDGIVFSMDGVTFIEQDLDMVIRRDGRPDVKVQSEDMFYPIDGQVDLKAGYALLVESAGNGCPAGLWSVVNLNSGKHKVLDLGEGGCNEETEVTLAGQSVLVKPPGAKPHRIPIK